MKLLPRVWLDRIGRRVAEAAPAPLAAPETPRLRRLRLSLLALLAVVGAMTAAFPWLHELAPMISVLVWQALALSALVIGLIWVREKTRTDNAWLMRGEDKR